MNLGELEFTREDFNQAICDFGITARHSFSQSEFNHLSDLLCAAANAALEDRLKAAPPIYGRINGTKVTWAHPRPWKDFGDMIGRLVGIERVK